MDTASLNRALLAIQNGSSIVAVSEFLRSKNVRHSAGSWEQLKNERILPAVEAGELSDDDIRMLVREAEDFGRQHIFFFEPTSTAPAMPGLIRADRIRRFLR